jgi:hypothetical protein
VFAVPDVPTALDDDPPAIFALFSTNFVLDADADAPAAPAVALAAGAFWIQPLIVMLFPVVLDCADEVEGRCALEPAPPCAGVALDGLF